MQFSMRLVAAVAVLGFASAALAEQIDNPEYTQWSKYKAGTFVTVSQATDMPGMAAMPGMPAGMDMASMMPQIKMTTKLTAVKPDALELEVTTDTTQMGRSNSGKTTRVVPAKIDKPNPTATATAPGGQAQMSDIKEGKETVDVNGTKIDTTWREFTTTTTASPLGAAGRGRAGAAAAGGTPTTAHMKVWSSPEIPGGMVKTESTTTVDQMGDVKMTMTVVDFKVVK